MKRIKRCNEPRYVYVAETEREPSFLSKCMFAFFFVTVALIGISALTFLMQLFGL